MEIYDAVKRRRSVRDYPGRELSSRLIGDLEEMLDQSRKFRGDINTEAHLIKNGREFQEDLSGVIADYGKVRAPHYIILTAEEREGSFVEVGYRYEFVVLSLTAREIGTCWIGKGFGREALEGYVELSGDQTVRALIACGPVQGDKMEPIEEPPRKDLDDFLVERNLEELDEKSLDVIDNLRRAPSSINSQPWKVLVDGGLFHLYLKSRNYLTRKLVKSLSEMNRIDAGIGLAHMKVAGRHHWDDVGIIKRDHPEKSGLEYVGSLKK
jgi:hypothetical protein